MKYSREGNLIARGSTTQDSDPAIIKVYDGTYKKGFRVVKFQIAGQENNANNDCAGKLTTAELENGYGNVWNWDDPREIAWASTNMFATGVREPVAEFIDNSKIVVRDLYVYVISNTATTFKVNYMVELEPVDLKEWEYSLSYVQNQQP